MEGIAWAIWSKYATHLRPIVEISEPEVSFDSKAPAINGLKVTRVPGVREAGSTKQPTGVFAFADRLLRIEENAYAVSIEPKELAHNVSEVSARENVLNLIGSIRAMLPQAGVTGDSQTQYLRRRLEMLHAITRRPLVVGFGQGRRELGWILGPRFAIDEGSAIFRHEPARHDLSAAIVVPAWWTSVRIRGDYAWIETWDGGREDVEPLMLSELDEEAPRDVVLSLPVPNDVMDRVTRALVGIGLATREPFLLASRPRPIIEHPVEGGEAILLRSGQGEANTVLIRGAELWRSPQVYAGSQRATRVEVTSDMKGILATFEGLRFPGALDAKAPKVTTDLWVVTSFGSDRVRDAVEIVPGKDTQTGPRVKATGKLLTRYVVAANPKLKFQLKRPDQYAKLFVGTRPRGTVGDLQELEGQLSWSTEGNLVELSSTRGAPTGNTILLVDLQLQPRPETTSGRYSVLEGGPASLAHFVNEEQRSWRLDTLKLDFVKGLPIDNPVVVRIEKDMRELFEVAYPWLAGGLETGLALRLVPTDPAKATLEVPLKFSTRGSSILLTATGAELNAQRAKLEHTDYASLTLSVVTQGASSDLEPIPVTGKLTVLPSDRSAEPTGTLAPATLAYKAPAPDNYEAQAGLKVELPLSVFTKAPEGHFPGLEKAASVSLTLSPRAGGVPVAVPVTRDPAVNDKAIYLATKATLSASARAKRLIEGREFVATLTYSGGREPIKLLSGGTTAVLTVSLDSSDAPTLDLPTASRSVKFAESKELTEPLGGLLLRFTTKPDRTFQFHPWIRTNAIWLRLIDKNTSEVFSERVHVNYDAQGSTSATLLRVAADELQEKSAALMAWKGRELEVVLTDGSSDHQLKAGGGTPQLLTVTVEPKAGPPVTVINDPLTYRRDGKLRAPAGGLAFRIDHTDGKTAAEHYPGLGNTPGLKLRLVDVTSGAVKVLEGVMELTSTAEQPVTLLRITPGKLEEHIGDFLGGNGSRDVFVELEYDPSTDPLRVKKGASDLTLKVTRETGPLPVFEPTLIEFTEKKASKALKLSFDKASGTNPYDIGLPGLAEGPVKVVLRNPDGNDVHTFANVAPTVTEEKIVYTVTTTMLNGGYDALKLHFDTPLRVYLLYPRGTEEELVGPATNAEGGSVPLQLKDKGS